MPIDRQALARLMSQRPGGGNTGIGAEPAPPNIPVNPAGFDQGQMPPAGQFNPMPTGMGELSPQTMLDAGPPPAPPAGPSPGGMGAGAGAPSPLQGAPMPQPPPGMPPLPGLGGPPGGVPQNMMSPAGPMPNTGPPSMPQEAFGGAKPELLEQLLRMKLAKTGGAQQGGPAMAAQAPMGR